jgi:hypothetical protein
MDKTQSDSSIYWLRLAILEDFPSATPDIGAMYDNNPALQKELRRAAYAALLLGLAAIAFGVYNFKHKGFIEETKTALFCGLILVGSAMNSLRNAAAKEAAELESE